MRRKWMWSMKARFQVIKGATELTKIVSLSAHGHLVDIAMPCICLTFKPKLANKLPRRGLSPVNQAVTAGLRT